MRQGIVHDETLQHRVHEQTSKLRQLNPQLQEEIRKRELLEEKLRTSEAKIRAVFESMTDIVFIINTQGNQIKDIEIIPTSSNRLYECDSDLIAKTVKNFFQDKTENTWFQKVRDALDKKQTVNFDYSVSMKGREVWFSASISPISDKSAVWVARDITERKLAEERWRLVLQGSQDGIWDRNLKTNEVFRSARWKEILGYEDHEISNNYEEWVAHIHPDDVDRAMQAREDYLGRKIPSYAVEYRLQCKDGSYKWVLMRSQAVWDESGSPVRMVGMMTDINERKLAEERLRLLERAIAASNNGIMIGDAQAPNNPVIYANSGFERITGYTKEEVIGKNCRFLQGTDTAQPALEELKRAIAEARETQVVLRNYRKDGTLFWNQFCLTPVQDDTGRLTHFIGIQTDISDCKQAEEALRQSEERFRVLVESAPVGIFQTDLMGDCLFVNPRWLEIAELSREEAIGIGWEKVLHPDECESVFTEWYDAAAMGREFAMECRFLTAQGKVKWVFVTAVPLRDGQRAITGYLGTVIDVSDRKLAEEQLRWQEALMRSMTSVSPLAFFVVDNRTDTILYFNHRFCEIWGIEHLEARMQQGELKNNNDIIPDCLPSLADVPAFAESCKPLQSEENRVIVEDEIPFVDGRTIRRFSTQVRDREDRYFGRLYIFEDITHRKIAEEALRQSEAREREKAQALERAFSELKGTQAQLIQAEKMSSLGQMVAGIAHEINNPTSFIYGNINPAIHYTQDLLHLVQLYRQHYPQPVAEIAEQLELIEPDFITDDFPKLLASMKEGAERISQIVLSLRNFSRLDESESKRVNIHEGIDNTLVILKHRLKQQPKRPEIRVIKEYGQLPPIECYPGQLNQVFMNIISNAIDALDEATKKETDFEPTILICTEVIKSDSSSSYSNNQSTLWVLIRIVDNSPISIKAELLPKIFDPFFTTKPVGSGTGLGLSISYQIVVDRHRGQLRCYSTPGAGTEFVIELPIAQIATSH